MFNYYQYDFISVEPLFARLRQELMSYFEAGMVNDLMFEIYLTDALRKLSDRGTRPIRTCLLFVDCHEAKLPPDFFDYREVWATFGRLGPTVRVPGAYYRSITTDIARQDNPCPDPCENTERDCCDICDPASRVVITTKTSTEISQAIRLSYLLTPGNVNTKEYGNLLSFNNRVSNTKKFHIHQNKMTVEFDEGDVYMAYYAKEEDCEGSQLIPKNFRIEQFVLAYIKYKLFEYLSNAVTDESVGQIWQKFQYYKAQSDEAFIMAELEMKKDTVYKKAERINKDRHRNDQYHRMLEGSWNRSRYRSR